MKFETSKEEKYAVIIPNEEIINANNAPDLKTEFLLLNNSGFKNIICDLSNVNYVDSSGLSAFLVAERICTKAKGDFVLVACSDNILKLIKLSQLDTILNITPTLKEGVDLVMLNELERDLR
ncbi:MAG: STAS domain-containing protein [Bacteroidetes bacterium]|nr:STAS domain-containing protein [Bacteroidota bacterium]MCB9227216.1 STAS domain-containing protein [Chitinophagales bacterium]